MGENYLVEHTVGSIIRSAFKIYFSHFGTLVLIYVLPVVPFTVIQTEAQSRHHLVLMVVSILLSVVVSLFAYGAITIAVSDVCVGNVPSFNRSYARTLGKIPAQLLGISLLQMLAMIVGLVLLVIPGLVFAVWFMLSPPVVVLEGKSAVAALKRSKQLGDGSHWRNVGMLLLLSVILFVIGAILGAIVGLVFQSWIRLDLISIFPVFTNPVIIISLVLIYYDRRVRKELYDVRALAEDLAR